MTLNEIRRLYPHYELVLVFSEDKVYRYMPDGTRAELEKQ